MNKSQKMSTQNLVLGAVLTALVIVLQFVSMNLRFTAFSITLTLVPIVIGVATCGPGMGAWLGFAFGLVVLLTGDAAPFMAVNPLGTVVTVLAKGMACGYVAGLVYQLLKTHNAYMAVAVSAVICPIVNTGVFLVGCLLFFMEPISQWAAGLPIWEYMLFGLVGINFLIELGCNIVLSPLIIRLLKAKDAA